jgi:hypothetical protein
MTTFTIGHKSRALVRKPSGSDVMLVGSLSNESKDQKTEDT